MNKPIRKQNRLRSYNYSSGGSYFLTICVKDVILSEIIDCGDECPRVRATPIGEIVEKHIIAINNAKDVTVEKYVIMPDHIHLIIFVENPAGELERGKDHANERVPKIISGLKRLTQKEIGREIFQRGYYDHIIRDDKDYDIKWQYIDDNPANWLAKKKWQEIKKQIT